MVDSAKYADWIEKASRDIKAAKVLKKMIAVIIWLLSIVSRR